MEYNVSNKMTQLRARYHFRKLSKVLSYREFSQKIANLTRQPSVKIFTEDWPVKLAIFRENLFTRWRHTPAILFLKLVALGSQTELSLTLTLTLTLKLI